MNSDHFKKAYKILVDYLEENYEYDFQLEMFQKHEHDCWLFQLYSNPDNVIMDPHPRDIFIVCTKSKTVRQIPDHAATL